MATEKKHEESIVNWTGFWKMDGLGGTFLLAWLLPWAVLACVEETREALGPVPPLSSSNIRSHVEFLSDDLLEGRSPGTRGGELAARYIATQFQLAGLEGVPGGSFFQMVPLVGISTDPDMHLEIVSSEGKTLRPSYPSEFVAWSPRQQPSVALSRVPLIFVGYGIDAPEVPWDDFKQRDVKGKVLLAFVNEPPSEDPEFFGGRALTYYGRWTYKLEEAARRGAAGVILVHDSGMAGYPWSVVESSWTGEQFYLVQEKADPPLVHSWVQAEWADRVLQSSGLSLEEAKKRAKESDFDPILMDSSVSIQINSSLRRVEAPNVLGLLPGVDSQRRQEVILVTSHYDHLGMGSSGGGDRIYNGALDNASGTAGLLELAQALKGSQPRRSVLFAAVTAEEQGLLGSQYYARHPTTPLANIVANLNVDSINVWGETEDIIAIGAARSTLLPVIRQVASQMDMELSPEAFPEKGYFFRSDQFSFVKVGVPAVYFEPGLRFRDKPEDWGKELMGNYIARHYHQPSDEFDPSWSFQGSRQMMEFVLRTILQLAHQEERPQWNPDDPFAAVRAESLSQTQ